MERITISLKSELAHQFDDFIQARGYSNRSEAMRDLIRDRLEADRLNQGDIQQCVGVLSYVFSHGEYELPTRLARIQHDNFGLIISNTHIQISPEDCLDTLVLRGPSEQVRALSDRITSERGVRHGRLQLIATDELQQLTGMSNGEALFGTAAVSNGVPTGIAAMAHAANGQSNGLARLTAVSHA